MRQDQIEALTEAIYDAAVDPGGWLDVMALAKASFSTSAETLYALDYGRRSMRPVQVCGITDRYMRSFEASFFTDDNPCTQSLALHRPGVIRTDQRLGEYFSDAGILRRSRYYNEWLQPQNLGHSMGMTPLVEGGVVFNLSLLRPLEIGPFRPAEVDSFERLQVHFRRALRVAVRLETLSESRAVSAEALDHLPHGVVFVTAAGKVLHCNGVAESLFRSKRELAIRSGHLVAVDPPTQRKLTAALRQAYELTADGEGGGPSCFTVPRPAPSRPLTLSAVRLSAGQSRFAALQPTLMLLIVDPDTPHPLSPELLHDRYGMTPAEARLSQALVAGTGLRQAAAAAGMTYETARWYLKILFQKTQTGRQSELVARLHSDLAGVARPGGSGSLPGE